ncbi:MAG: class I tRNA ligase family protein, partial [Sweet potato little leaf phytoplasma]|nr:class I tRNA ligase family protein [Sweet potato little leaf phytoplasma]
MNKGRMIYCGIKKAGVYQWWIYLKRGSWRKLIAPYVLFIQYVDMSFGSGLLKVTPAHDFNDFQLGQKHNLK